MTNPEKKYVEFSISGTIKPGSSIHYGGFLTLNEAIDYATKCNHQYNVPFIVYGWVRKMNEYGVELNVIESRNNVLTKGTKNEDS